MRKGVKCGMPAALGFSVITVRPLLTYEKKIVSPSVVVSNQQSATREGLRRFVDILAICCDPHQSLIISVT